MGYVGPGLLEQLRISTPEAVLVGIDTGYFAHCLTGVSTFPEDRLDVQYFSDLRTLPEGLFDGVDAVVHLAAISNDPMGDRFKEVTHDINFKASLDVAKKAKAAGTSSFVFASSCSVYGFAEGEARNEQAPLNPLTAYAKSKIGMENELNKLASDDFVVTCLRFATACGASDRLRLDLVLNDFVAGAIASKQITVLSDGTPWRPLIHVKDMALAIDWALQRSSNHGGAFLALNSGRDEWNYQVRDLAEAVAEVIPGVEVSINKDAPEDKRSYQVDFGLYKKLAPEHQPQMTLKTSIEDLAERLEFMNFSDGDFRNSQLIRLKVLAQHLEQGRLNSQLEWQK
ncbi:MAG: SDR family oxidoreductase [Gammaproteobacteria bacterium]|nr:MAG: SDR family oxidoreductase [Gammaproteobacteria bacterium]